MNIARGSGDLITRDRENTRAERVAASRVVLRHAKSREDLRLLLDALGLNSQTSKETNEHPHAAA
ncbi:hypothetical protein [Streptomyces mexicanus]|uniref:hypothetical protein n=1 Tax=Streptomyces mexicanus TaxID=178566 RepID=UPI0036626A81